MEATQPLCSIKCSLKILHFSLLPLSRVAVHLYKPTIVLEHAVVDTTLHADSFMKIRLIATHRSHMLGVDQLISIQRRGIFNSHCTAITRFSDNISTK
jgi:hypothetical protein